MVAATSPGLRIGGGKDRVNFRLGPKAHQSVIPTLELQEGSDQGSGWGCDHSLFFTPAAPAIRAKVRCSIV
jgi:hypothetical protein